MDYLSTNGILSFSTGLILMCVALKQLYDFVMWWKGGFYSYHKDLQKKEKLVETITDLANRIERLEKRILDDNFRERVAKLENHQKEQDNQFKTINEDLDKIIANLTDIKNDNDRTTVAQTRSLLYTLYNDGMAKGYTTQPAMETFEELSDIYLAKNGNSIFKHHIIPEYKKLRIIDLGANFDELLEKEG
jgi:ABC-type transporter Mla subunit MlaD